jgi:minor extracellular serine protease Vpr
MKYIVLSFLFISSFVMSQGTRFSVKTKNDVNKIQLLSAQIMKGEKQIIDLYPIMKLDGEYYVSFLGKKSGSTVPQNVDGIFYGKPVGNILSVRVRLDKLSTISSLNGIANLELAGKIKPDLDRVVFDTRVDSVHAGYGLPQGYTGKDVFIGITDWGFDYSSPMFYDTAMQATRIHAAWDQFKTSGPNPAGYNYGTEYTTPAQFVAVGADTANIYSYATHGSHVAGIAGGGGAGIQYRGMAIESKFLFATFLIDEAGVLDAWQWMYDIANGQGKRLVMNMSWGLHHIGTNDGNSLLSQAIANLTHENVIFCTSGGNNGDVNFHIKKDFNNDSIATRVNFYNYNSNPYMWGQSLHAWGEVGENFEMKIQMRNSSNALLNETVYFPTTLNAYVDTFMVSGTDTVWYNIAAESAHPLNNRPTVRFRVKNTNTALRIMLLAKANSGRVHFWNVTELTTDVGNWGMPFTTNGVGTISGDHFYGIGEPAATTECITVAAHSSNYLTSGGTLVGGTRAVFSSVGPRYDEVLKPDISAPGVGVRSSISSYTDNSFFTTTSVFFQGRTYPFAAFSGTSMSSPAVAGICALILDANPYLSPAQVKQIIIETARLDNHTGPIGPAGDSAWGFGKVNAYAAIQQALVTVGLSEIKEPTTWSVYPNPTSDILKIDGVENIEAVREVQMIDASGKISVLEMESNTIRLGDLSEGTYILRFIHSGKVYQTSVLLIH